MKSILTTSIGDFTVEMSYVPSSEDRILNRMTAAINKSVREPLKIAQELEPDLDPDNEKDFEKLIDMAITLLDEAQLEKALYECTCCAGGSGQRLQLNLKSRSIELQNW